MSIRSFNFCRWILKINFTLKIFSENDLRRQWITLSYPQRASNYFLKDDSHLWINIPIFLTSLECRINIMERFFQPRRYTNIILHKLRNNALYNYIASDKSARILNFKIVTLMKHWNEKVNINIDWRIMNLSELSFFQFSSFCLLM